MKRLTLTESEELKRQLKNNWGITAKHWVPLEEVKVNKEVIFFPQDYFFEDFGLDGLRELIKSLTDNEIYLWHWETRRKECFSLQADQLVQYKSDLHEKYICDNDCSWVIYMSHENTIAFAGQRLLTMLKQSWINWKRHANKWHAIE